MHRRISLQIRQGEVYPPVAAVGRSKQGEERLVLVDGQELTVTHRPAFRGEVEGHNLNFREKGFGHGSFLTQSGADRNYNFSKFSKKTRNLWRGVASIFACSPVATSQATPLQPRRDSQTPSRRNR